MSHRFTGFWHLMTGDIMNQTSEVLTDAHIITLSGSDMVSLRFTNHLNQVFARNMAYAHFQLSLSIATTDSGSANTSEIH